MKNATMSRFFRLFGALALTLALGAMLVGCNAIGASIGGGIGLVIGLAFSADDGGGIVICIIFLAIIGGIIGTFIEWFSDTIPVWAVQAFFEHIGDAIRDKKAKKAREAWLAENEKLKQRAQQGDVAVQYQLGERYHSDGNREEAKKWYKMAVDNGNEEAKRILADIAAKEAAEKRAEEERKAREEAERKAKEERAKAEQKAKEDDLKWARENFNLLQERALSKAKSGNHSGAIADWEKALEVDTGNTDIKHNLFLEHYNIATESFRAGDISTAKDEISKALIYDLYDDQAKQMQSALIMASLRRG